MFDSCTITMFLSVLFLFHCSLAFYLKEDRYKKEISEFEEVETITDPVKVKLLMAQPAKEEVKFTPVLIPDKFSKYDSIDHDGHISLKELIKTTGAERNAKSAFQAADEDADGEISREEFKKAPWAMKPTSVNSKDNEDYIDKSKFENVIVEEEVEAENIEKNHEGIEDLHEEKKEEDEERVGDVEMGQKYEEGGEESFIEKVERKGKVSGNKNENQLEEEEEEEAKKNGVRRQSEPEEGDREVIIEEKEKEVLEGYVKEAEREDKPTDEESKVGGVDKEEATEKRKLGRDDIRVEVEEGDTKEIENSDRVRNKSVDVGKGKEGENNEKEEKSDDKENEKEVKNEQEGYISKSKEEKYIEIGNLERHIQRSNSEILDLHKTDETVGQIEDNFIENDLEGHEWFDSKENSGEFPETNFNQDSYSDEEQNTSEESYESFTD